MLKAFWLRPACGLLAFGLASSAGAVGGYPIAAGFRAINKGSNMRFQIGNGLPVPITGMGTPLGAPCTNLTAAKGDICEDRVFPFPGAFKLPGGAPPATVSQTTTSTTGNVLKLHPYAFFGGGFPVKIGVFKANPAVFQVKTNLKLYLPKVTQTFSKGGRTGPATVSWCPGFDKMTKFGAPNTGFTKNPACAVPASGKALTGIPGRMEYTKTKNQFGGPGTGKTAGTADVALVNKYPGDGFLCKPPGKSCIVSFVYASPLPTGANGAAFSAPTVTTVGKKAYKYKVYGIASKGTITAIGASTVGKAFYTNVPASDGGPWTTGMLTITATATAAGMTEKFIRTGTDMRAKIGAVAGVGNISLVAGAVSQRTFTGPNANRGWITLTIPEPGALASAAGALLALVVCHRAARRRSR